MTIPHKQAVMSYLDSLTESAQAIGAVNTVIKTTEGQLRGDNTGTYCVNHFYTGSLKVCVCMFILIGCRCFWFFKLSFDVLDRLDWHTKYALGWYF